MSIEIISHLDSSTPYVQVVISGVTRATMELTMYEGKETIERNLSSDSSIENEVEMFWPMETPAQYMAIGIWNRGHSSCLWIYGRKRYSDLSRNVSFFIFVF